MSGVREMAHGCPATAPLIAALQAACFAEPWGAQAFHALLAAPNVATFVAEDGSGEPNGYAVLRCAAGEGEILSLGVVAAERQRGLGRALVEACFEAAAAAGALELFLEVAAANRAARALYQSAGFEAVGRRPVYYPPPHRGEPGDDAITLSRSLVTEGQRDRNSPKELLGKAK